MEAVSIANLVQASVALKPLRVRILAAAREPVSAATIAGSLGMSRQAVNYHVRALAKAGFLRRAGRQRKRGLVEQKYVVSARAFLVAPDALGPLDAGPTETANKMSVSYLVTLAARVQQEATRAWRGAEREGKRVPVLAIDTELRFADPQQRAQFAQALTAALTRVIADHSMPTTIAEGPAPGRRYRLALGCYPL